MVNYPDPPPRLNAPIKMKFDLSCCLHQKNQTAFSFKRSSRSPASRRVASFLAKFNRMRCLTGSRKKLDPGTAATPISFASQTQNSVSSE